MIHKRILVTGGAGFIGSNLARYLSNQQNHVIVLDDLSTGQKKNIDDLVNERTIEFIEGSVTDLDLLQDSFQNIDYIFHEAALPSVPRSIKDPLTSNDVNINGTLNVLIAAKDAGVKKVIYASSSSVYGDTPTLPKLELMIPNPLSPYAITKLTGEYYCQVFTNVFHLPSVALRYFNVYGPRQDPSSEYAAVIPKFITSVMNGQSPIIYGDGEQTRDFTYVDDVIQANILAAESNATGVFNAAGGRRITINELATTVMNICGKKLNISYKENRPGDIKHSLADSTKAHNAFGFTLKYDLEKGLKETIKWYQKQQ
jgi:UDP-glucose 4-epimerase